MRYDLSFEDVRHVLPRQVTERDFMRSLKAHQMRFGADKFWREVAEYLGTSITNARVKTEQYDRYMTRYEQASEKFNKLNRG